MPIYSADFSPYTAAFHPDEWQREFLAENEALSAKAQEFESLLQSEAISGDVTVANCEPSLIPDTVARRAMVCDLVIVSDELRSAGSLFSQAIYGVLFGSPIAVLLNGFQTAAAVKAKNVFIAWNTGLSCARAIQQAMPILRNAEEVTIGIFDPVMTALRDGENPGSDLAMWLSRHSCNVQVNQYPSGGNEIGDCIIGCAKETGADLVVMGAYGHSRMREDIFGGTTRTLIEQQELAVLLAH